MYLLEFFQDLPPGYGDEKSDHTTIDIKDTRKTRLTLAHLNKIRMVNDVRKFENEQKIDTINRQYAPPQAEGGAAAPMGL